MSVWLWVAIIGLAILVVSMVFDGIEEIFGILDFADGLFSLVAIGSGLILAGVFGYAFESEKFLALPASIPAIIIGVIAWFGVSRIVRNLKRRALAVKRPLDLRGLEGIATAEINDTIGEIQLDHPQELNKRLAITTPGNVIHYGDRVVVIGEKESQVVVLKSSNK